MEEIDVWRAANMMIEMYGADASFHAGKRADRLMDQGDSDGFHVWKRITKAIEDLGRMPSGGEPLN